MGENDSPPFFNSSINVKTLIKKFEDQKFSFGSGFITVFSLILLRNIMESIFENTQILGFSESSTHSFYMIFVHFPIFYLSLFLWIFFIFLIMTQESYAKVAKVLVAGIAIVVVTPFIDIVVSRGSGYRLTYLSGYEQFTELHRFFNFTIDLLEASWGQRIEILFVLIGGFSYIFIKTRNIIKSLFSLIVIYLIIWLHGVLPNTIARIPSYLGSQLSLRTIITNGILAIDSQNYAVIFALSAISAGGLILSKVDKKLFNKIFNLRSSALDILFLIVAIICASLFILRYYPFIFQNPISYLIFLLAGLVIVFINAAASSPVRSLESKISIITSALIATALGPVFLLFSIIFYLVRRSAKPRWLAIIPCFLAGLSLVLGDALFVSPVNLSLFEVKGRELAGWCYFLNRDYEKAQQEYAILSSLESRPEIIKRCAQCYLSLGNLDEGIRMLEQIEKIDYEIALILGEAYGKRGLSNKAIQIYRQAIAANIEPAEFYLKIGQLAAKQNTSSIR
jgi:tetratricopeptide (TPR) repeat protein